MSKGEGFTKEDARHGQRIINWIRDHRITQDEIDMFYPMGKMIYEAYDELDDENKLK